jgi:hypothetical protein
MRSPPASEIRIAAPANPLAFTYPFYQTRRRKQRQCFRLEKRIHRNYGKTQKMQLMDLAGINVVVQKPSKDYDPWVLQCKPVFSSQCSLWFSARLRCVLISQ